MREACQALVRAVHGVRGTQAVAREVARSFGPGAFYALEGDLGAGKTCFVQGLCDGLGVRASVSSPTFAIANEYDDGDSGRRFVHLDLYRLSGPEELDSIGWDDYLDSGDSMAVEWPDRAAGRMPPGAIRVRISSGPGPDDRTIEVVPAPPFRPGVAGDSVRGVPEEG